MSERVRASIFAKLVTIMLVMAVSLLAIVSAFFGVFVGPDLNDSFDRLLEQHARAVAAQSPNLEQARKLGLHVRYEGPGGGWATSDNVPHAAGVKPGHIGRSGDFLPRRMFAVAASPLGGTYLVAWDVGAHMFRVHMGLFLVLLVVMIAIVAATHAVLRNLLQPLRALNEGVAQLGAGQLNVLLAPGPADEFGRLTAAFNQMVVRVREMIHGRDQLLVDVSHELRSPVTRMRVALELLPHEAHRARLAEDVAEMDRMITELLELERLRTGRGVELSHCDMVSIVRDVVARADGTHPGVRVIAAPTQAPVNIDAEKIRTVLRNLLENAIKYSLPESRPVELTVSDTPDGVVVRITDDGIGIPDDDLERVFEPFFRVDRSRSKNTGGYGLGLSICKRVMEAHHGSITVERLGGRGASFVLAFPKRSQHEG
ncbi:MAG: HAMP domain-containing sensor histidine kinase [bacterium]